MRTVEDTLSGRAELAIRRLARRTAREGWIAPCDDHDEQDYGTWEQEEFEGWEQTDQFQVTVNTPLMRITDQQAKRQGFDQLQNGERWLALHQSVKEIFWEEWAEKVALYDFWAENVEIKA